MLKARWLYWMGGWIFTGLALLGALLPLLPTTPFLLLAGTCFARSSPRMRERIWRLPIFGPYLRQWDESHTVPRSAKRRAWFLIAVSLSVSIYLAEGAILTFVLVGGGFALMLSVAFLPEGAPHRDLDGLGGPFQEPLDGPTPPPCSDPGAPGPEAGGGTAPTAPGQGVGDSESDG